MVQHIDPSFLRDPRQYTHSQDFWRTLWNELLSELVIDANWESPWLGTPLRDGNSIFSAVCRAQSRAVHVIQHEPSTDDLELEWWLDHFGEVGVEPVIQQVVISCALSDEAARRAIELMRAWVTRGQIDPPAEPVVHPQQTAKP